MTMANSRLLMSRITPALFPTVERMATIEVLSWHEYYSTLVHQPKRSVSCSAGIVHDCVGSLGFGLLLFPSGFDWLLSCLGVPSVGLLGFSWEVLEGVV